MSWVRLDDGFHRNEKQLKMSDQAFRIYVCSMSWCAQISEPTGYLTTAQARALVVSLGKKKGVIAELVRLNAWEEAEGGFLIHDYDQYLERGSRDRVRRYRERKRLGNVTGNAQVTPAPSNVTGNATRARRVPEPEPEPVDKSSSASAPELSLVPVTAAALKSLNGTFAEEFDRFVAELNYATGRRFRGDAASRKLYARARHEGRSASDLLAAARGVAKSAHHMGLNDNGIPYNAPSNVLRSKVLDQLISLGNDEIGLVRKMSADERRQAEIDEWVRRGEAGQ